jgi:hypothetical protein
VPHFIELTVKKIMETMEALEKELLAQWHPYSPMTVYRVGIMSLPVFERSLIENPRGYRNGTGAILKLN